MGGDLQDSLEIGCWSQIYARRFVGTRMDLHVVGRSRPKNPDERLVRYHLLVMEMGLPVSPVSVLQRSRWRYLPG